MKTSAMYWCRNDLRLLDNPALSEAINNHDEVFVIYILDDTSAGKHKIGGASRWWLYHTLKSFNQTVNNTLALYLGEANNIINQLIKQHNITDVYWNRCYEPWQISRDKQIKATLKQQGINVHTFNASLLWEPWTILKKDNTPYKVFTPYFRKGCLPSVPPRPPINPPEQLSRLTKVNNSLSLDELNLLPTIPWYKSFEPTWQISEQAAHERLHHFIDTGLPGYKEGRDFPAKAFNSKLSPYLHFGQISPHQVLQTLWELHGEDNDFDHFYSELAWREFSYYLLYHYPSLPSDNFQPKFNNFSWQNNKAHLTAWQQGQTGHPLVDAGMRELWQTGFMHNRVRMVVGSFLVKNLLIHWHEGEAWFWDCLVDADLASNSASWQWIAGCGADAAPYFRVFNPALQGEKFDKQGHYTRKYVPELAKLPDKYLFTPWQAPDQVLQQAGIKLGVTYPKPIVDLAESRARALAAYSAIK